MWHRDPKSGVRGYKKHGQSQLWQTSFHFVFMQLCHEVKLRRKINRGEGAKVLGLDHETGIGSEMLAPPPNEPSSGQCELTEMDHSSAWEGKHGTGQSLLDEENALCKGQKLPKKSKVGFIDLLATGKQKGHEALPGLGTSEEERKSCSGALHTVSRRHGCELFLRRLRFRVLTRSCLSV